LVRPLSDEQLAQQQRNRENSYEVSSDFQFHIRTPKEILHSGVVFSKFVASVGAPEYYFLASAIVNSSKSIYHSVAGDSKKADAELKAAIVDLGNVVVAKVAKEAGGTPANDAEASTSIRIAQTRGKPSGVQLSKFKTVPGGQGNFVGHGTLSPGAGTVTTPNGTSLVIPADNVRILDVTGQILERGAWWEIEAIATGKWANIPVFQGLTPDIQQALASRIVRDVEGMRVCLPGDLIENYTLDWPKGLTVHENSSTVGEPTDLGELLEPNMGCKIWAACTEYVHK